MGDRKLTDAAIPRQLKNRLPILEDILNAIGTDENTMVRLKQAIWKFIL